MLDVRSIRKDFPIFNKGNNPLIYLDSASTTQKPHSVIDAITSYYNSYTANIHRALYTIGEKATDEYEKVREKVKLFLNVPDTHSIIFTGGTTESINLVAHAWGIKFLEEKNNVIISEMEHHSNLVPWQMVTEQKGALLKFIPLADGGTLNLKQLDSYFSSNTKLMSLVHQSNVFGTVNPIKSLIDKAKSVGAITMIDGAQAVPHSKVDITQLDCDFYAFSGHKMTGPTGVGVLIGRIDLLEEMDPFMGGGEMIETVTMESSTWNSVPYKFEAGTPNFAQAIGLGAAVDYLDDIRMEKIAEHEQELTYYALDKLGKIENLRIYGNPPKRGGVISFNLENIHPHDLAQFLNEDNIAIRVGHHCAQPLLKTLGETATARLSFYIYNDTSDVDKFCESLISIREYC